MKNTKKLLPVLLSIMIISSGILMPVQAEQTDNTTISEKNVTETSKTTHTDDATPIIESGECGEQGNNVLYEYHESGTLYIYGSGEMAKYSYENAFPINSMENVVIEYGITNIGDNSFYYCPDLTSVQLPDTLKSIGSCAFSNCASLEKILLPDSVTGIGTYAFYNCTNLAEIEIPCSTTILDVEVFGGCTSLAEMIIPEGVSRIEYGALWVVGLLYPK